MRIWKAEYMPFGKTYAVEETKDNNRLFIGKELDSETNLSYFGARYLDSDIGRFLAPDPVRLVDAGSGEVNDTILGDPQRLNLYAYGLNNPYRYVDPDGRSPEFALSPTEYFALRAEGIGADPDSWQGTNLTARYLQTEALNQIAVMSTLYGGGLLPNTSSLPKIYGTQKGLRNPELVGKIKESMLTGKFNYSSMRGRIGGYLDSKGRYFVSEGHHRMAAAKEILKDLGDSEPIKKLLQYGRWEKVKKAPPGSKRMPSR